MRVLLISHTCQSRTEGQPKAEQLARLPGIELRVVIPNRWMHYGKPRAAQMPEDSAFTLSVEKVAWPWAGPAQFYLHWYPRLAKILKEFRPDIIDLWEEPWGLISVQACLLRNRLLPSAKIISETEQNLNKSLPFPFEAFRSYTLSNADFAVGRNSEAVVNLRAKGYTGPTEVVPNAVDTGLFVPMDRKQCRASMGLTGFVAGYIGRLVEEKGLMDMVDALPDCPPDVSLLFVGDGPFRTQMEERARGLGIAERVRILHGRPLAELPAIMNAIDALVLPSRTTPRWKEQFGRVIIEAHACGTPVIGSDSGAIPEVVGKGGIIVPERCPSALAEAITSLRQDPAKAREMGRIGREQVLANYTWERVAARMYDIYCRVMAPSTTA